MFITHEPLFRKCIYTFCATSEDPDSPAQLRVFTVRFSVDQWLCVIHFIVASIHLNYPGKYIITLVATSVDPDSPAQVRVFTVRHSVDQRQFVFRFIVASTEVIQANALTHYLRPV